ncbi:hypothetical protein OIU79_009300 [Salix purpurea]|uniref:Uncharacterized protein n=1 Tax=Salix purpurea TaxID=77065 RepID=A0A9Q0YX20_SALPP|nr:hypothetical protein OIU79_009300 [Salix purpurea]
MVVVVVVVVVIATSIPSLSPILQLRNLHLRLHEKLHPLQLQLFCKLHPLFIF